MPDRSGMKIEQVEVTIGTDGKMKIQTLGFSGSTCLTAVKEVEELLGNLIVSKEMTAESYDQSDIRTAEKLKIHR